MSTTQPVKIPPELAQFADPATRPLHMRAREVEILFEYWWSGNGYGLRNKLLGSGVLVPVKQTMSKKHLFETESVLRLYSQLTS